MKMKTTRTIMITVVLVALVGFVTGAARADWNEGDPYKMHHPQLPDLNTTGMDVLGSFPDRFIAGAVVGKVLADDWKCSESGPVTDIHIWSSWWEDILPVNSLGGLGPENVSFKLSIHADIPAVIDLDTGRVLEHSRPGEELWTGFFEPGDPRWSVRLYADNVFEEFYDPNLNQIVGIDTRVFQYNFLLDPADAFEQKEGTIYWLDVIAVPEDVNSESVWGWKTSLDHFNDDAVFGDTLDPVVSPTQWSELRYPAGHPFQGESIDLAFVITPEPATLGVLVIGASLALLRQRRSA